jgi:membrane-associated phospholipid phosphatase
LLNLLTVLRNSIKYTWCGCLVVGSAQALGATPSLHGQSGYINMPSASVEADGTFSMGYSYGSPYSALWASSTILPFLQVTGRYVSITGIPGFTNASNSYGSGYGRYKDKVADAKLKLWDESARLPSIAVGATDLLGTELFKGQYVVATKNFGSNLEASIGYGRKRPDGLFAGARWKPDNLPRWALVAEYDANDYAKDFRAADTAAGQRSKGPSLGVEYRWGWLGVQATRHRNHSSINAFVSIPFSDKEFVPKVYEPASYTEKEPRARPSIDEWKKDAGHSAALAQALAKQDYKNIRIELKGNSLNLALTNRRISNLGRAVGRATRTALALAPVGIRTIRVTYTKLEQPVATYEFFDLNKLNDYLAMKIDRQAFLQTVLVRYPNREDVIRADQAGMLAGIKDDAGLGVLVGQDGDIVQVSSEDRESNRFKVVPKLGFFFNDPSGALRYELTAATNYDKRLGEGLYLNGALGLTVAESISGVTQGSNSLLPHVRTDVADYKRGGRFKLHRLLLNKYATFDERWYARFSGGIYEEMFRGVGSQILYLPKQSHWAADLSVDALQQRDVNGWLGKRDYQTVTALGALHYRLPYGITATARAGRFLAKDVGVRAEFKRRFRSGIEVGAWYTRTNGKDTTSPGTIASPYNDKGIFLSIPLGSMLAADSQASAGFSIAPWTRDVGQMVASPGDLYALVESPRRDMTTVDGLGNFAERPDEQNHPAVNPPDNTFGNPWPAMRARLDQSSTALPSPANWVTGTGLAAGAVLVAALSDKKVDRFMKNHAGSRALRGWNNLGNALPYALVGAAGAAVALGDEQLQNTGLISLQSVAAAAGIAVGAKYIVGRARPTEERGPWSRVGDGQSRSNAAFPSGHATIAFAAVTPFAKAYDAPWLYGLAAAGSMGRVAGRKHWFSDTVGGGLLGYAVGSWLWQAQRDDSKSGLSINPGPREISVTWQKSY